MGRHSTLFAVIAVAILSAMTGCAPVHEAGDKPVVVVSIPPLEYFVDNIGGDKVKTESLAPASADPETFEPSIALLSKASETPLMITVGLLPFEEKVAQSVKASNPDVRIVSLADSINLIEGTHGHEENHGHLNYDPHIWTSLRNARIMARQTCRVLSEAFPDNRDYFKARLDSLDCHLDSLDKSLSSRLEPFKDRAILVWHPSLSYFARDYGLRQIAVGHEHKESSITGLKERLDLVRREKPAVFFYQKEFDSRQSKAITDAIGLRPVVIAPLSPDIEAEVKDAAEAVISGKN